MKYNFDNTPDRRTSDSIKWNFFDPDVIPMWVADMDFVSPDPVIEALHNRVAHKVFGYPTEGIRLKEGIVEKMVEKYSWTIQPEDIVFLPGVIPGFNLACQALGESGKGILVQTPVYPPILGADKYAGMVRQDAELIRQQNGRYEIDFDHFEATITPLTQIFLFCNPHNPVGRVYRRDELEKIAEICLRKNIFIVSDEIHCDLVFDENKHIPIASLDPAVARKTITLMAPSKTYNLAGLKCSFAIITEKELRDRFNQARRGLVSGVNVFGIVAAEAAYRQSQEWLDQMLIYLQGNRDLLSNYIHEKLPELGVSPVEGTYLAWLDCRKLGLSESACEFFLRTAKVGLNDGATFGKSGHGFVRLNFGCSRSTLTTALDNMFMAIQSLCEPTKPVVKQR
jgi:cystathionine beta-lyase